MSGKSTLPPWVQKQYDDARRGIAYRGENGRPYPEPAAASEFGGGSGLTPPGLENADPIHGGRYHGKAASDEQMARYLESLPPKPQGQGNAAYRKSGRSML